MKRESVIALTLFFLCLVWVFSLQKTSKSKIQSAMLGALYPLHTFISKVEDRKEVRSYKQMSSQESASQLKKFKKHYAAKKILEEEVANLKKENNELRSMLRFVKRSHHSLVPARVIKRTSSNWWSSFVINKGIRHGIATDSPVRSELGLVGKTAQISSNSSAVILLTDEKCRVAVRVEGTREQGIIMGFRGDYEGRGLLRLKFLSKDANIPAGRRVYSSGAGGLFPENVLIGTVVSFVERDIYGEATVRPAVDFSTVQNVFVIKQENNKASPKP